MANSTKNIKVRISELASSKSSSSCKHRCYLGPSIFSLKLLDFMHGNWLVWLFFVCQLILIKFIDLASSVEFVNSGIIPSKSENLSLNNQASMPWSGVVKIWMLHQNVLFLEILKHILSTLVWVKSSNYEYLKLITDYFSKLGNMSKNLWFYRNKRFYKMVCVLCIRKLVYNYSVFLLKIIDCRESSLSNILLAKSS